MNIDYLGTCADRQHKATLAVAQQLVCLPAQMITSLPIVVRKGGTLIYYHSGLTGPQPDMDYVNPFIMNGSFSLELRLKYLHALETGNKIEHGHKLKEIFDNLTQPSKKSIRALFSTVTKDNSICKQISMHLNENEKMQFRWDIDFLLEKNNLAFERWRYIYEQKGDIAWFCGYTQIKSALDLRINEINFAKLGKA